MRTHALFCSCYTKLSMQLQRKSPCLVTYQIQSITSMFTFRKSMGPSTQHFHTLLATSHLTRAWKIDSGSFPQAGQISHKLTPLLCKFTSVGRAIIHIFQAKILILDGMFKCHSFFHRGLLGSPKELSPSSIVSNTLTAI